MIPELLHQLSAVLDSQGSPKLYVKDRVYRIGGGGGERKYLIEKVFINLKLHPPPPPPTEHVVFGFWSLRTSVARSV